MYIHASGRSKGGPRESDVANTGITACHLIIIIMIIQIIITMTITIIIVITP